MSGNLTDVELCPWDTLSTKISWFLDNLQKKSDFLLLCQSSFALNALIDLTLQTLINEVLSTCDVHDGIADLKSIIWDTPKW